MNASVRCIALDFIVLVLSETVLVLEKTQMTAPIFDHERLDVYPLAIDCVASSYRIAKSLNATLGIHGGERRNPSRSIFPRAMGLKA
jgi:hypothetical protein